METLKQRILEHIADLLDEPTFESDMMLADCIDPLPSDKSELHLMMAEASFKVLCNYFGKQDNTEQYTIHSVVVPKGTLCDDEETPIKTPKNIGYGKGGEKVYI